MDEPFYLTVQQQAELLEQPDIRTPAGLRNHTAILLMLHIGLRISELLSLRWTDLDLDYGMASIPPGVSDKPRMLFFTESDRASLRHWEYIQELHSIPEKPEPVFTTIQGRSLSERYIQQMVTRYAGKAGLTEEISPRTLRSTFAVFICKLLHNQIKIAREALGYHTLSAVKRYLTDSKIFPTDPAEETLYRDIIFPYLNFADRYRNWNSYVHLSGFRFSRKWLFDLVEDLPDWVLEEDLAKYI